MAYFTYGCSWITEVRNGLSTWLGLQLAKKDVKQSLQWLRRKWNHVKKELIAAVWGAMIYYTWMARNWKVFSICHVKAIGLPLYHFGVQNIKPSGDFVLEYRHYESVFQSLSNGINSSKIRMFLQ